MPSSNPSVLFPIPDAGVQADRHATAVAENGLVDAENVLYRDGVFASRPGLKTFGDDVNERPMGFYQWDGPSVLRNLVMGTSVGWRSFNKGTKLWTDVTDPLDVLTGGSTNHVRFRYFVASSGTEYVIGVNGKDTPKKWDGNPLNTYTALGGTPRKAKAIAIAAEHVVLAGFTDGPQEIEASAYGDPDSGWATWTARLAQTSGPIVGLEEWGPYDLMCYKTDGIFTGKFTGVTVAPFLFELLVAGVQGPVSPAAIVHLPDGSHAYLGRDGGVYLFNGSRPVSLGAHIQRWIADRWLFHAMEQCWGAYNPLYRELVFVYPHRVTGSLSHGIVIRLDTGAMFPIRWDTLRHSAGLFGATTDEITFGDVPEPYGMADNTFSQMSVERWIALYGDAGGQVYEEAGVLDGWSIEQDVLGAIPIMWEFGLRPFAKLPARATGTGPESYFDRTVVAQAVKVQIGASAVGEARTIQESGSVDLMATGTPEVPLRTGARCTGRFHSLRYEADASQRVVWFGAALNVAERGPS